MVIMDTDSLMDPGTDQDLDILTTDMGMVIDMDPPGKRVEGTDVIGTTDHQAHPLHHLQALLLQDKVREE